MGKIYFCQREALHSRGREEQPHHNVLTFENGDTHDVDCAYLIEAASWRDLNKKVWEQARNQANLSRSLKVAPSALKSTVIVDFGKETSPFIGRAMLNLEHPLENNVLQDIRESLVYYSGDKQYHTEERQKEYHDSLAYLDVTPVKQADARKKLALLNNLY